MSDQHVFGVTGLRIVGAVILLALVPIAMGQTTPVPESDQPSTEIVDEIVVYGDKSLNRLRLDQHKAQDKVFALFNTLNSDDEFDIHCANEAPIGSHIRQRVCVPNFVKELRLDAVANLARGLGYNVDFATIDKKEKELQLEMEGLIFEYPELLEALNEFADKKQYFESEYERKCKDRIVLCRK